MQVPLLRNSSVKLSQLSNLPRVQSRLLFPSRKRYSFGSKISHRDASAGSESKELKLFSVCIEQPNPVRQNRNSSFITLTGQRNLRSWCSQLAPIWTKARRMAGFTKSFSASTPSNSSARITISSYLPANMMSPTCHGRCDKIWNRLKTCMDYTGKSFQRLTW